MNRGPSIPSMSRTRICAVDTIHAKPSAAKNSANHAGRENRIPLKFTLKPSAANKITMTVSASQFSANVTSTVDSGTNTRGNAVFVMSEACAMRLVAPRVTLSANASHGHKPTARNAT